MTCATANVAAWKLLSIEITSNNPPVLYLSSTKIGEEVIDFTVYIQKFFSYITFLYQFFLWLICFMFCAQPAGFIFWCNFIKTGASRRGDVGWWSVRLCVINMLLKCWKRWNTRREPEVQPSTFHAIDRYFRQHHLRFFICLNHSKLILNATKVYDSTQWA